MLDEGAQEEGISLKVAVLVMRDGGERVKLGEGPIGERVAFEVSPGRLDRIKLRRIGREEHRVELRRLLQKGVHHGGPVRPQPIPEQDEGGIQLAGQLPQERDHQRTRQVGIRMQAEIQVDAIALRGHTQGADDRDLLVRARPLDQDRGLAAGAPRPADEGCHQKAALVQECQPGPQPRGFFLARGQSCLIQRWMAASSRSRARRWGCWGLKPNARRSRPR